MQISLGAPIDDLVSCKSVSGRTVQFYALLMNVKKRENLFMIQHFSRLNFDGIVRQMRAEPSSASFTVFAREAEILS